MNKRTLGIVMTLVVVAAGSGMFVGCKKKSSSKSGAAPAATSTGPSKAVADVMAQIGMAALVPSGVIKPAAAGYTVGCPGGGNVSVDDSGVTAGGDFVNTITNSGSVVATLNSCVTNGYTLGGTWTQSFNFTDTFTPNVAACSTSCTFAISGTIAVPSSTITVAGADFNGSCALNITETFSGFSISLPSYATTGSVTYSGTVCGTTVSGSCNMATMTCS